MSKLDGDLEHFANNLAVPSGFRRRGNETFDRLARTIQADGLYSIDRVVPVGGISKKTSVGPEADYDVVAYVNGLTDKQGIRDHFKQVLRRQFRLQSIMDTGHVLKFHLDGVDFDLLFDRNVAGASFAGSSTTERQFAGMMDHIRSSGNTSSVAFDNSAGLSEVAVEFVKRQSPFVHKVAILAKKWKDKVNYPGYISGQSSIFELIAIKAGTDEEKSKRGMKPSIVSAFNRFLGRVLNLKNQKITEYEFYRASDVPDHVRRQAPLLLDPSNPYNNFMHKFPSNAFDVFRDHASKSQGLLARAQNMSDIEKIFS